MLSTAVGLLAGLLTTAANVPQVWKTYRNRSGEGLSFQMLVILASGLALWIVYGALSHSMPIIMANAAGLALVLALIRMKLVFGSHQRKSSPGGSLG
jgi:MtN3 and saliva related transmembrane protein